MFAIPFITKTTINASIGRVREEFMDLKSWDEWNPMVKNVSYEGELTTGTILHVHFAHMDNRPADLEVVQNNDDELSWVGIMGHGLLFSGYHFFRFRDLGNGRTSLEHGEDFTGLLTYPLIWYLGRSKLAKHFQDVSDALKARVESKQ